MRSTSHRTAIQLAVLFAIAVVSASFLAGANADPVESDEDHWQPESVRARGEKMMSDFQQTACGYNGYVFSSLTRAKPDTDWGFSTSDKHYSWCGGVRSASTAVYFMLIVDCRVHCNVRVNI